MWRVEMKRLPNETLEIALIFLKTIMKKCENTDEKDCSDTIDKVIVQFLEELKEYRSLEEQGLLLRLPTRDVFESCGDTVYYIFDYEIVECINCGVSIDCDRKIWIALAYDEKIFPYRTPMAGIDTDPTDWCTDSTEVNVDEFGKTIFLTQEEAEQKVKELMENIQC